MMMCDEDLDFYFEKSERLSFEALILIRPENNYYQNGRIENL